MSSQILITFICSSILIRSFSICSLFPPRFFLYVCLRLFLNPSTSAGTEFSLLFFYLSFILIHLFSICSHFFRVFFLCVCLRLFLNLSSSAGTSRIPRPTIIIVISEIRIGNILNIFITFKLCSSSGELFQDIC